MRKNRLLNSLLMTAVVLGLSMSVTSCKDDDDEKELTEEQKEEKAAQLTSEYEAFWSVVGQLTDVKNRPEDWKNATFEPTYGEPDESNAFTRVRIVNDVEEAALLYSYIVNIDDFDQATPTHTFENPAVGTLKYSRSTDGKSRVTTKCVSRTVRLSVPTANCHTRIPLILPIRIWPLSRMGRC